MKVDFHCHSRASDGTWLPASLVAAAMRRSFAAIALTDHDGCSGVAEFLAADSGDTLAVAGVEFSVEPGEGFDKFHLLGLGIDPESPSLRALAERAAAGREERNKAILENFAKIGIRIPLDELVACSGGGMLARPHIARWLCLHGYAPGRQAAFEKYLLPNSPAATRCHEERWRPAPEDAFRAIREAGGISVMAHPRYWRRRWRRTGPEFDVAERGLAMLKESGLDGLECLYQANTRAENAGFTEIATRLGLLKTAGSDFHGANKPDVKLGMEVPEGFAEPVIERLSRRRGAASA